MKIVILDGHTLNPGDLSFEPLKEMGSVTCYDRTPSQLTAERIGDAEIVFTNKTLIDRNILDACPNIRYIGLFSTGYNVVDIKYAAERGITVTNVPAYSTGAVAQHVFALVLAFTNKVAEHDRRVQEGEWTSSRDFCFYDRLTELEGKTMGVVGYGRIGRQVAKIANAFGMSVLANTRTPKQVPDGADIRFVDFDTLLAESDIVSLHCPLFEETKGLIGAEALQKMKPTALLINTSRGPVVNQAELAQALNKGVIAGAGLDVIDVEPMTVDNPLLHAKNCIITPHIAWAALETRKRLLDTAVSNLRAFLDGSPVNVVNSPEQSYQNGERKRIF